MITEYPSPEIPPTSEPSTDSSISPSRDTSPMVNTTGRRHCRRKLGERGCYQPVEDSRGDELVNDTGRTTVVYCHGHTASQRDPVIAR